MTRSTKNKYPSVTEILKAAGLTPDERFFKPEDSQRGTRLHKICIGSLEGPMPVDLIQDVDWPYIGAFNEWRAYWEPRLVFGEKRLEHPYLKFCGKPDMVISTFRDPFHLHLPDLKTGGLPDYTRYQLAGYEMLVQAELEGMKFKRYGLQVTKEGKYNYKPYTSVRDRAVFLDALEKYEPPISQED